MEIDITITESKVQNYKLLEELSSQSEISYTNIFGKGTSDSFVFDSLETNLNEILNEDLFLNSLNIKSGKSKIEFLITKLSNFFL